MIPYTEEDMLIEMSKKNHNIKKMIDVFELELDFSKRPLIKHKQQ